MSYYTGVSKASARPRCCKWMDGSIDIKSLLKWSLFVCGFLAVQRFTMSPLNALVCLIPLALFLSQILRGRYETALTCLFLALVQSVDNGGNVYAETLQPIRYFIYVSALICIFFQSNWRLERKSFLFIFLMCSAIFFGVYNIAVNNIPLDLSTLQRDILVLVVLFAVLFKRKSFSFDLNLLYYGCLGWLIGEVANTLFFYNNYNHYLSYSSMKAFIFFPLIYAILVQRRIVIQFTLLASTAYVVMHFGSRMIVLTALFLFLIAVVFQLIRDRNVFYLALLMITLVFLKITNYHELLIDTGLIRFKAIAFTLQILEISKISDSLSLLERLDPIRFQEYRLFFDRPILSIMFGSGLGSGIYDSKGFLEFVSVNAGAFSKEELFSANFFNFHDYWTDFGVRFGLIPVSYLFYQLVVVPMWSRKIPKAFLFGLMLLNVTFATPGIIALAFCARFWPDKPV